MEKTIYTKLLEAQREIASIKRDSNNPFFHSKYFDINAILREVKPILNKHGLVLVQGLSSVAGLLSLDTRVYDETGKFISSECPITQMPDPQKQGSAITYFRRYALQSFLALEAEDDDGNVASGNKAKVETKSVKKFMEDLEPTEEDLIKYDEKLESANTLAELKKIWTTLPPLVQDKLESKKEELKRKLS